MSAPPLIWLPGALDQFEHAALDTDVVRAGAAGVREIVAVCSASVLLCSLATPTSRRCPECDAHASYGRRPAREPGFRLRLPWGR